jgi:hypothetical protein
MEIVGDWFNELGSQMTIVLDANNPRLFHGSYHTAVGTAQERKYDLVGSHDIAGADSETLGWVVTYDPPDAAAAGEPANGPTTCAWSGQAQVIGDMPYLVTTWVLTGAVPREENWTATTIGTNYFFRTKPTPSMLGAVLAL